MRVWIPILLATTVFAGCPRHGTDEGPHCEDTATVVAIDEETPLGFSAAALVALAVTPSPWADTFTYRLGGATTPMTVALAAGDGARFVDSEAVYPEGGEQPAIAIECPDRVEIDVTGTFATDDGAFDEPLDFALNSLDGLTVQGRHALDPFALVGSHDITADIDALDLRERDVIDEVTLAVEVRFDAVGSQGGVRGQVTTTEECFDDGSCTASAAELAVGAWGTDVE